MKKFTTFVATIFLLSHGTCAAEGIARQAIFPVGFIVIGMIFDFMQSKQKNPLLKREAEDLRKFFESQSYDQIDEALQKYSWAQELANEIETTATSKGLDKIATLKEAKGDDFRSYQSKRTGTRGFTRNLKKICTDTVDSVAHRNGKTIKNLFDHHFNKFVLLATFALAVGIYAKKHHRTQSLKPL
ncbi:hypothetical protein HOD08_02065 [bacterium]|nr:hypothetical protein [bacterium]